MQCDVQPKCGLSWKNIPFTPVCGGQTPTTLSSANFQRAAKIDIIFKSQLDRSTDRPN